MNNITLNVGQFVAVNEYGACLLDTVANTPAESAALFAASNGMSYDTMACAIVQLVPVVVLGRPHGYWMRKFQAAPENAVDRLAVAGTVGTDVGGSR